MVVRSADDLFHALADATRRDIVAVVLAGERSVTELAGRYPMSFAAVQKHVAVLERAGLVVKRRHGREQRVRGVPDALAEARGLLDQLESVWRARIDRIDQILSEGDSTMTVTDVVKDHERRTMTITAEFGAPVERVWQIWADPRQLERWWGPPTYPATVVDHDLTEGGAVNYFMTGPDGDKHAGWWRVSAVAPPRRLEFEDGFADGAGRPSPDMPVTVICVSLEDRNDGGTRMEITSTFATVEAMEQLLAMGMDEGMKAAMGQIDEVLA